MRHFIALSLAVIVPFTVVAAAPPTPTCLVVSGAVTDANAASVSNAVEKVERARIAGGVDASGPTDYAINTKGTGTSSGRSSMAGENVRNSTLQVTGAPGGSAGSTVTAHAINTKGTGTSSGRASSKLAIKTKGTGAQRQASSEMAINTKGPGVADRVAPTLVVSAPGHGEDCDD